MSGLGWTRAGLALVVALHAAGGSIVGCGTLQADLRPGIEQTTVASELAAMVAPLFAGLAGSLAPMPVYGPAWLPAGAAVPAEWWPAVELSDPAQYDGPATGNPRILGEQGHDAEAQVIVEVDGGWLVVLENFRGDLGDVTGVDVGIIEGHEAHLYWVNGGELVQWSDGGRWYGVFGRAVPGQTVVDVALGMQVMSEDASGPQR